MPNLIYGPDIHDLRLYWISKFVNDATYFLSLNLVWWISLCPKFHALHRLLFCFSVFPNVAFSSLVYLELLSEQNHNFIFCPWTISWFLWHRVFCWHSTCNTFCVSHWRRELFFWYMGVNSTSGAVSSQKPLAQLLKAQKSLKSVTHFAAYKYLGAYYLDSSVLGVLFCVLLQVETQ